MKINEKISALIDAYIELAQNHHYNDSQIIDSLTDIFDEEELKDLGYGDFIFNYFHDDEEHPVSLVDISKVAYDLYVEDWVEQHTTPEMRLQSIREYHTYAQECREEGEKPCSYESYLAEHGYNGSLYVCYDEFCDMEYHDKDYIRSLLGDDVSLVNLYYKDIDCWFEESEDLSVVADVLSEAESRCLACAAHENAEVEQMLD